MAIVQKRIGSKFAFVFLQEGDFTGFQTDGRWALRSGDDVPQSNVFTFFFSGFVN